MVGKDIRSERAPRVPALCTREGPDTTESVEWSDSGPLLRGVVEFQALLAEMKGMCGPPEDQIGRFSDFEITALIGRGGQATVFRAWDKRLERDVALKFIDTHWVGSMHLWQQEAHCLARVRHPNVVQIFDAGSVQGRPYLVMEYVQGWTLAEVLSALSEEGPSEDSGLQEVVNDFRSTRSRLELAMALASALVACHRLGVLHRDLKPANVRITPEGVPKLLDFGLAHGPGELTPGDVTQKLHGTFPYLAPEQLARGRTGADPRSDIYSLGAVLYELFGLRRAFPQREYDSLRRAIRFESPPEIPGIQRELSDVIEVCLRKQPEDRYESVAELLGELRSVAVLRPIRGKPQPLTRRMRLWLGRHRRGIKVAAETLGATCVLGLVSALAISGARFDRRHNNAGEVLRIAQAAASDPVELGVAVRGLLEAEPEIRRVDHSLWTGIAHSRLVPRLERLLDEVAGHVVEKGLVAEESVELDTWVATPWRRIGGDLASFDTEFAMRARVEEFLQAPGTMSIEATLGNHRAYLAEWRCVPGAEVTPENSVSSLGDAIPLGRLPALGRVKEERSYRLTLVSVDDPDVFAEMDVTVVPNSRPIQIVYEPGSRLPDTLVPAGVVRLRSRPDGPEEEYRLPAFLLDRSPVSVGAFRNFLEAHPEVRSLMGPAVLPSESLALEGTPCVVPWEAAAAYARYRGARLPTLLEMVFVHVTRPHDVTVPDAWLEGKDGLCAPYGDWCGDAEPAFPTKHRWVDRQRGTGRDVHALWYCMEFESVMLPGERPVVFRCARSVELPPSIEVIEYLEKR